MMFPMHTFSQWLAFLNLASQYDWNNSESDHRDT